MWRTRIKKVVGASVLLYIIDRILAASTGVNVFPNLTSEAHVLHVHSIAVILSMITFELITVSSSYAGRAFQNSKNLLWKLLSFLPWLAFITYGVFVGLSISKGDWVKSQSWVGYLLPACCVIFMIGGLVLRAMHTVTHRPQWNPTRDHQETQLQAPSFYGINALYLVAGILFYYIDYHMLPGLYIPVHNVLYALVVWMIYTCVDSVMSYAISSEKVNPNHAKNILISIVTIILLLCFALGSVRYLAYSSTQNRANLSRMTPRSQMIFKFSPSTKKLGDLKELIDYVKQAPKHLSKTEKYTENSLRAQYKGYNVLFVMVDTLRSDVIPFSDNRPQYATQHTSQNSILFHQKRDQTLPFMKSWLTTSYQFTNAYAQSGRTKRSMPALFKSLQVYERNNTLSNNFATRFNHLGYETIAVVPEYFLWPVQGGAGDLINPFSHVKAFHKRKQHNLPKYWNQLLQQNKGKPFFAWVHLYMMHAKYFHKYKYTTSKDGSLADRYLLAAKTLDQQFKNVVQSLKTAGVADKTIIVFASDHGESLGDNQLNGHGASVYEEESHVPLAIYVPGTEGGVRSNVVGNIDIVPTLFDLLGMEKTPTHRGNSLVPLMDRSDFTWPYHYLLSNGNGSLFGFINQDRYKLIVRFYEDLWQTFDVNHDPQENKSIFGKHLEIDQSLITHFLKTYPRLGINIAKRYSGRLVVDAKYHGDLIDFWNTADSINAHDLTSIERLTALSRSKKVLTAAFEFVKRNQRVDFGVLLARESQFFASQLVGQWIHQQILTLSSDIEGLKKFLEQLIYTNMRPWRKQSYLELIKKSTGFDAYIEYVMKEQKLQKDAMDTATQGAQDTAIKEAAVIEQTLSTAVPSLNKELLITWLKVFSQWKIRTQNWKQFVKQLVDMMPIELKTTEDTQLVGSILQIIRQESMNDTQRGEVESKLLSYLDTSHVGVKVASISALSRIQSKKVIPTLKVLIKNRNESILIRKMALEAFAHLKQKQAISFMIKAARDKQLQPYVIKVISTIIDQRSADFLRKIYKTTRLSYVKEISKQKLAYVESRLKSIKKPSKKKKKKKKKTTSKTKAQ